MGLSRRLGQTVSAPVYSGWAESQSDIARIALDAQPAGPAL
jgi:hypothetical protein